MWRFSWIVTGAGSHRASQTRALTGPEKSKVESNAIAVPLVPEDGSDIMVFSCSGASFQLSAQVIDIIAEEGLAGVTMAKVAERTGLSRGICNFHFETKEHLMLEAFRMLYNEHERAWRKILSDPAETPVSRLRTFVETLLLPPIADHKKLAVWMAFWGVAPHRQTYREISAGIDREYETEVEGMLHQLSGGEETIHGQSLQAIAITLTCMIDGFWVNYLIGPDFLAPEVAVNACLAYLARFFPEFDAGDLSDIKGIGGNSRRNRPDNK